MKKTILKIVTMFFIATSLSTAIPVIDAPQLYENGQTIVRWAEQIKQWEEEITQWKQKYDAITGFKLDGSILDKFIQINDLLVENGLDMGDLDINNPKSELGRLAGKLLEEITFFDNCSYDFLTEERKKICKDGAIREVQEMVAVKQLTGNVDGLLKKLNSLNTKLEASEDIKTSQDITAAMESTFASLEIVSAKFEMMAMRNKAKKGLDARVKHQIYMKKFENIDDFVKNTYGK